MAPEPWHLSYRPLADNYQAQIQIDVLRDLLGRADILLKDILLSDLDEIIQRFVQPGY